MSLKITYQLYQIKVVSYNVISKDKYAEALQSWNKTIAILRNWFYLQHLQLLTMDKINLKASQSNNNMTNYHLVKNLRLLSLNRINELRRKKVSLSKK